MQDKFADNAQEKNVEAYYTFSIYIPVFIIILIKE